MLSYNGNSNLSNTWYIAILIISILLRILCDDIFILRQFPVCPVCRRNWPNKACCPTSRTCRMCSPPVECVGMWGAWATDTRYRSQQVFHKARHSASCYYDPQPTTNMRLIADLIDLSCCYFICMYIIYMNSKHFKILIRELRTGEKKTEALLLHVEMGWRMDLLHKSHNVPGQYPTMHHSEQKCAHFCSELCILGYGTGTLWDLWIRCIVAIISSSVKFPRRQCDSF